MHTVQIPKTERVKSESETNLTLELAQAWVCKQTPLPRFIPYTDQYWRSLCFTVLRDHLRFRFFCINTVHVYSKYISMMRYIIKQLPLNIVNACMLDCVTLVGNMIGCTIIVIHFCLMFQVGIKCVHTVWLIMKRLKLHV